MSDDACLSSGRRTRQAFGRLKARIRALEGAGAGVGPRLALGVPAIDAALSADGGGGLPLGCLHDISGPCGDGACLGFALWLAGRIAARQEGAAGRVLWAGCGAPPYPPGLAEFGLDPARLVHIRPGKPADIPWVLEEAARTGAAPVIAGDLGFGREGAAGKGLDLTASRRLQLACEPFGATLLLLSSSGPLAATGLPAAGTPAVGTPAMGTPAVGTAASRWRIQSLPSRPALVGSSRRRRLSPKGLGLKGLGPAVWQVDLLRARGGRPGSWPVLWQGAGAGLALLEEGRRARSREGHGRVETPEAANAA